MTDFQIGDRVSVEGVVTAVIGRQVVMHPDRSPMGGYYFRPDALTLVERPKRKLRREVPVEELEREAGR